MSPRTLRLPAVCLSLAALGGSALAAPTQLSEITVNVMEEDQPLVDVLRRLERTHGLNYVVAQDVLRQAGTVTVHLKEVPLDVALESICSACGLALEIRGPVLVILPKGPGSQVVPRVEAGAPTPALVEQAVERQRAAPAPARPVAPPRGEPAASDEPDLAQTVGTLLEVDRPERRLVLRVDGLKRDFYLPATDDQGLPGLQISRLEQALETLKPGTRIAILYRRDAIHPVVTDLVGGAFAGTAEARTQEEARRRRARERRAAAEGGDAAAVGTPSTGEPTAAPGKDDLPPTAGTVKVIPAGPQAGEEAAPEGVAANAPAEEGILAGKFLGLEGEQVRIQRASDSQVVSCWLPPEADGERRARVKETLSALSEGAKLYLTFELEDGKRFVTNTITETR